MDARLTRGADGIARRAFDLDEIARMRAAGIFDPDEKFELIDGEIIPMSPQNLPHMRWRTRIGTWFANRIGPDLELLIEATLTISLTPARTFEPDVLVFRPRREMQEIHPADVLLAIEVADSTRERDLHVKAPRYAQFGVAELWVVDLNHKETHVHRKPEQGGYAEIERWGFGDEIAPLFNPGLVLKLDAIAP